MSEENVRAVRVAYETAYAERSVERVRDHFAEDFIWHNRPEWPGRATYTPEELPQLWADLDETFEEYDLAPAEYTDLGDWVLVQMQASFRVRDAETTMTDRHWHLWRVVDGTPLEGWARTHREEAMEIIDSWD